MRRILIFGNSGSGKTTLAKIYCSMYGIAHLDLDTLAWEQTSPPKRKPLSQSKEIIEKFLRSNEEWVIEGCYSDLLALVEDKAHEAVFLNPGVDQCVHNCRNRAWEPHKYFSKEEQDANLSMLLEWIKQYPERNDEFSLKSHRAVYDGFQGKKVEYQSNVDTTSHFGCILE